MKEGETLDRLTNKEHPTKVVQPTPAPQYVSWRRYVYEQPFEDRPSRPFEVRPDTRLRFFVCASPEALYHWGEGWMSSETHFAVDLYDAVKMSTRRSAVYHSGETKREVVRHSDSQKLEFIDG